MSPSPEVTMPVSAVVSLYSESQRISLKLALVQRDLSGKRCVGMRRSRESNPALAAQCDAKRRMILQLPGEFMSLNFQASTAECLANFVSGDSEVEWVLSSIAQIEIRQRKSLNETLRFILPRKPHGPHLNRHPARIVRAAAAPRIHQQISEPPRSAAVRQSHTNKPDFVTSLARETRISLIESVHAYIILGTGRGSELREPKVKVVGAGFAQAMLNCVARGWARGDISAGGGFKSLLATSEALSLSTLDKCF